MTSMQGLSSLIPFQLHRRIPLLRRPFDRLDALGAENARLRAEIGTLRAAGASPSSDRTRDLKQAYTAQVERTASYAPTAEAMSTAIGGDFERIGQVELMIVKRYGLKPGDRLIDVGCGSGRLAVPLSSYLTGRYSGYDIVDDLVDYARATVSRPDWRFEAVDHIGIPEPDGSADMVCFFSVLTHLTHEQSYWYLEEARRVVKPGGTVIFSFLEFAQPNHWAIFEKLLRNAKDPALADPMSVFIERNAIELWGEHLDFEVHEIRDGAEELEPGMALGQSFCVMRRPLA